MPANYDKRIAFLQSEGFHVIPLRISITKHLFITGEIEGIRLQLMLDTGASHSCIHQSKAHELDLQAIDLQVTPKGLLNLHQERITTVEVVRLQLGTVELLNSSWVVLDLSNIKKAMGEQEQVDGIIGGDLLGKYQSIIDYEMEYLFLKHP